MEVTADESPPGTPGSIVLVPDTPESSAAAVHDSIVAAFGVVESDGEEDQLEWEGGAYSEVVSPPHTPTAARSDETPGSEWSENLFADVGGTPLTRRRGLNRDSGARSSGHSRSSSYGGVVFSRGHSREGSATDHGHSRDSSIGGSVAQALFLSPGGGADAIDSKRVTPATSVREDTPLLANVGQELDDCDVPHTSSGSLMGMRPLLLIYICVFAMSAISLGYDLGVISVAKDKAGEDLNLSDNEVELMAGTLNLASAIGGLLTGAISDRWGRRYCLLLAGSLQATGSVVMAFSVDYGWLVFGRFLAGLGVGSALMCGPLYTAELSPQRFRGALVTVTEVAINVGIVLGFVVGYLLVDAPTETGWRWMLGLGTVPAGAVMACVILMPESPRWLMDKGRVDEAEDILITVCTEEECEMAVFSMQRERDLARKGSLRLFFCAPREWRGMLLVGIATATFAQASGIEAAVIYLPQILSESTSLNQAKDVYLLAIFIGLVKTLVVLLTMGFVDKRWGRRPMLLVSGGGMATCMMALGLNLQLLNSPEVTIVLICLFMASFSLGYGPVGWVVVSEVFPLQVRGIAVGFSTFLNRLVSGAVASTYLTLTDVWTPAGVAFLYACMSICAFWFTFAFVPETKGRSLEEIESTMRERGFCTGRDQHGFVRQRRSTSYSESLG